MKLFVCLSNDTYPGRLVFRSENISLLSRCIYDDGKMFPSDALASWNSSTKVQL